jgi:ammonium transporter Rh
VYELLSACAKNDVKKVKKLVAAGVNGASADYDQRTALHLAASEGAEETVEFLVKEGGADINAVDRFGRRPLDDAITKGNLKVIQFMRDNKAQTGEGGGNDMKLISAAGKGDEAAVSLLLKAGVDANCADYDGRTPLHLAVANQQERVITLLTAAGADVTREDRWGVSPLKEAKGYKTRVGHSTIYEALTAHMAAQAGHELHRPFFSRFWVMYTLLWLLVMVLISVFGKYTRAAGGFPRDANWSHEVIEPVSAARPISDTEVAGFTTDFVRFYPMFQDVHVMIFLGFGLLMSFLRVASYSAIGIAYLIAAFTVVVYHLMRAIWLCAFAQCDMPLSVADLVLGEFCAGALLIAFGVVIGRVSPSQMLLVGVLLPFFYSLNEEVGVKVLGKKIQPGNAELGIADGRITDIGGSITIHMFGALFGLVFSMVALAKPQQGQAREKNSAVYHSDMFAMVGTLFLWMYWPSFNAAPATNAVQANRAILNTYFSLASSCVVTFIASYALRREKRFLMVDVQNATLAGGVAMGSCADLAIGAGASLGIGAVGGLVSVLGYVYVQPFLEKFIGLRDTCGVNNLHCMPSFIGAFASLIAIAITNRGNDPLATPALRGGNAGVGVQAAYMGTTVLIACGGAVFTGLLARLSLFEPLNAESLFSDALWWETPTAESPYYHDLRGEVARGLSNEVSAVTAEGTKLQKQLEAMNSRMRKLEEGASLV